jgi:DNA-binding beta-propeller fold protein YncE
MTRKTIGIGVALVVAFSHAGAAHGQATGAPVLQTVVDVPMPGPAVRFDYQTLDTASRRLYIAHMNAGQLVVFDVGSRTVVANLDGFEKVHGVIAAPAIGRVYASVTARRQVAVVDATTLAVVARVGDIEYPDGLAYVPGVERVFVSDERGGTDAVLDVKTNRLVASVPLGGGAGNTVYDPVSRMVLVAVHGKNELVTIDPATARIVSRLALPGVADPHGIVLDIARHVAFVAGEGNATLAVVDLEGRRVLATHAVPDGPDVLAFDPGWHRLYVSSESGGVAVFTEDAGPGPVRLERDGELHMPHAHTVAVDPRTHLVYFPLENVDGKPLLRIMRGVAPAQ